MYRFVLGSLPMSSGTINRRAFCAVAGTASILSYMPLSNAAETVALNIQVASNPLLASHLLNRIAFGATPGDIERVTAMGAKAYIEEQLEPQLLALPAALAAALDQISILKRTAPDLINEYASARQGATPVQETTMNTGSPIEGKPKDDRRDVARSAFIETTQARWLRVLQSPRQLEETLVEFWYNHFNVFIGKTFDRVLIAHYESHAIRPFVLGRFRDMLGATAKHPAMLHYLDNMQSIAAAPGNRGNRGLNENYARELMELHTLGVDGGYSQTDVTELARILTGWTIDRRAETDPIFTFISQRHDWQPKKWLGYDVPASGQAEGEWALDTLAKHPATAAHLSYKLAQYFVADEPPKALVQRMAQTFLTTDGNLKATLKVLLTSDEFLSPNAVGKKFKTPMHFVASAIRATGAVPQQINVLNQMVAALGMPLYGCQTPDGYKNTQAAWLNPEALSRRINQATTIANIRSAKLDNVRSAMGPALSDKTLQIALGEAPNLQVALVVGSPDFMKR